MNGSTRFWYRLRNCLWYGCWDWLWYTCRGGRNWRLLMNLTAHKKYKNMVHQWHLPTFLVSNESYTYHRVSDVKFSTHSSPFGLNFARIFLQYIENAMEASLRWGGFAKLVIAKGPQRKKRLPYKKQNETTTTSKKKNWF